MPQKKITLIQPSFSIAEYGKETKEAKFTSVLPPLGLMYLAAVAEKEGYTAKIIDGDVNNFKMKEIVEIIKRESPEIVGIYVCTSNYKYVLNLAEHIRKYVEYIILGGPHITVNPKNALRNKNIDLVVFGDGEETFIELINTIHKKKGFEKIKGIGFKKNGELIINEPRPFIKDLDKIPFPARHLVPLQKYKPSPHQYIRQPSTTMITSRGCPFRCKFCFSSQINKRIYRNRSVDNVIAEIKYLQEKYGIKEVQFWDDVFGLDKKWLHEFCDKLIKEKIDLAWFCEQRANLVDFEILKKMKKAGCYSIFYGFESLNQEILDFINKDITRQQIINAIKWTKKAGIIVRANFILGLPYETPKKTKKMIKLICKLNPDYVKWNLFCPYPGTEIYDELKKRPDLGKMLTENSAKLTNHEAVFIPKDYKNSKELEEMRSYAFRKFYMRPKYFLTRLLSIRGFVDIQRYLRGLRLIVKRYIF